MRVAVVGVGGTGSPMVAGLLTMPWVEEIYLIDGDRIELSNLPRQPWYDVDDVGRLKAQVLSERFEGSPRLHPIMEPITPTFSWPEVDLVLDGTDNWPARRVIQAWSHRLQRPWLFSSALRWEGQVRFMLPGRPCLYCLFGERPMEGPHCFEAGVLGGITLAVAGRALELVSKWHDQAWDPDLEPLWLLDGLSGTTMAVGMAEKRCHHGGS